MQTDTVFEAGLRARYRSLRTLWALVPALLAVAVFAVLFEVAQRMAAPDGPAVIALQRSFTVVRFEAVIAAWGDGVAGFNLSTMILDFAFPLLYALGLSALVALAAGPRPGRGALAVFALPWAAALLDWLENTIHLWLLADVHTAADAAAASFPAPLVFLASVLAMLKFGALLTAAAAAAFWGMRSRRWWAAALAALLFAVFGGVLLA